MGGCVPYYEGTNTHQRSVTSVLEVQARSGRTDSTRCGGLPAEGLYNRTTNGCEVAHWTYIRVSTERHGADRNAGRDAERTCAPYRDNRRYMRT